MDKRYKILNEKMNEIYDKIEFYESQLEDLEGKKNTIFYQILDEMGIPYDGDIDIEYTKKCEKSPFDYCLFDMSSKDAFTVNQVCIICGRKLYEK